MVDGYVRVSRVAGRSGDRFISPTVQRERIEAWAARNEAMVAHVFEELDESGGRADRPLLLEAIGRVERGESDGIVVAYLSRFGRSLRDAVNAIERITEAGGSFVTAQEGLDFSTDTGRLVLRVLFSIAEWDLDRMRSNWAAAQGRAVARGCFLGQTPFGYRRGPDKRLVVDAKAGRLVGELFRRRADGAGIGELRRLLEERRIRTSAGKARWSAQAVRGMLAGRVYLGESRHGEFVNPAAHPALIDTATWDRAQSQDERLPPTRRAGAPLLSGLLRCAGCRRALQTSVRNSGTSSETRWYKCGHRNGAEPCPAPAYVHDSSVEPYVEALFWQQLAKARHRPAPRREERLRQQLERRENELDSYRDNRRLPGTIGPDKFADGLAVRARRVDRARVELSRARLASEARPPRVTELREQWPCLTGEQRRAAIATVIECAFLSRGGGQIERRLVVCLRGRAPADLPPRNPRRPVHPRPFDPASCPPPARLHPGEDWSEARLREALAPFLAGRERWPSFPEFQAAGLALAFRQVERHGGPRRWARLLDLPYVPPRAEGEKWPEERIRAELRRYLDGQAVWPGWRQFRRDGQGVLRRAVKWTGGPERWAPELGLKLPTNRTAQERWSYARIKDETASFTRDRTEWPVAAEFRAAGLDRLHEAIKRARGRERLALDLGLYLPADGKVVKKHRWTEPAIKDALDTLLTGRDAWPSKREFREAGLNGLHQALWRTGRRDAWARRYGVPVGRR